MALFSNSGAIQEEFRFLTPSRYSNFLLELRHFFHTYKNKDFQAAGVGVPGLLDRASGRAFYFGNLPWRNVNIQSDIEKICNCPVVIENDAKVAGLYEATLLKDKFKSVLYITISTGIGTALVVNGTIDINVGDAGGHDIILEHKGKNMPWESFVSGKAIKNTYGKLAKDITDERTWQQISRDLAKGFIHLIAIMEPEAIVIGGSVGTYFSRYDKLLEKEIKKYHLPMVTMPKLLKAQSPEEAVIYGCYKLAQQAYGKNN